MSRSDFDAYVARAKAQHGDRLDLSDLPEHFRCYFRERIRVRKSYGEERNGVLSVTTGWKPIFILILRSGAFGSSFTVRSEDQFVRLAPLRRRGRK